ncbi:MAG: peptidoglycan-binding domain-containing protein [Myxococcota bacterium]|nr:peptidoglycan-binding domain-containing protein [Myxococcota bacterium]
MVQPVNLPPPPAVVNTDASEAGSSVYQLNPQAAAMSEGSRGLQVKALQKKLTGLGYRAGPIDGDFGALTTQAVRGFQRANGLSVDGIAGRQTISALLRMQNSSHGDAFEMSSRPNTATGNSNRSTVSPPVVSAIEPNRATTNLTGRLHAWYQNPSNFRSVRNSIRGTRNMCANYITTAMEKSGVLNIPRTATYVGFGDNHRSSVRMWAPALARYLEREEGWQRVYGIRSMKPGDVLFTNGREGTYNHVMMLDSWVDKANGIARVTDNQGFAYQRNLFGGSKSPVSYALRK